MVRSRATSSMALKRFPFFHLQKTKICGRARCSNSTISHAKRAGKTFKNAHHFDLLEKAYTTFTRMANAVDSKKFFGSVCATAFTYLTSLK